MTTVASVVPTAPVYEPSARKRGVGGTAGYERSELVEVPNHRQRRNAVDDRVLQVDGHSVHRADATTQWLQHNASRIERFFLPGYAPDLNPDELLNGDIKRLIGQARPRDRQAFASGRAEMAASAPKATSRPRQRLQ